MKFSMTGQEKVTFQYMWLLNRGDCMGRLDCTDIKIVLRQRYIKYNWGYNL